MACPSRHILSWKLLSIVLLLGACGAHSTVVAAAPAAAGVDSACAMYSNADKTLLFGGVHGGCSGSRCQPRQDEWSELCNPATQPPPFRGYATCTANQTAAVIDRLQQEPDFSKVQNFTPCALYRYLKGRTLWVMGDSLMRNYYYALRCFMLDFWDHQKSECAPNPKLSVQRSIYRAADTNISSSMGSRAVTDVPKCLYLVDGGRICWVQSVRGEEYATPDMQEPGVLQVLQNQVAASDDIFFLNFGRWHYTNCFGIQEAPYRQSLHELGRLYQRTKSEFPNMIFKTISADHTACKPSNLLVKEQCLPIDQGSYPPLQGRRVVSIAEEVLGRYGVPMLDTYNVTQEMHLGHILQSKGGVQDCTHYCSPGVPEWEIWNMYNAIRRFGITPLDRQAAMQGHPECVPVTEIFPPPGWSAYFDEVNFNKSKKAAGNKPQQQQQQLVPSMAFEAQESRKET